VSGFKISRCVLIAAGAVIAGRIYFGAVEKNILSVEKKKVKEA